MPARPPAALWNPLRHERAASQAIPLIIRFEMTRSGIELTEAVLGSNPHDARAIDVGGDHSITTQRPGIIRVVLEDGELASRRIETM